MSGLEASEVNTEYLAMHKMVVEMRALAIRSLTRMYRRNEKLFAFRIRRTNGGDILEGVSRRYTAIALLGLLDEPHETIVKVLAGHSIREVADGLIQGACETGDCGELALVLWLARSINHPQTATLLEHLVETDPVGKHWLTVELSWLLSALVVPSEQPTNQAIVDMLSRQLMLSFNQKSSLFPHTSDWRRLIKLRSHVACFADQVYPIEALARYYQATGDQEALRCACSCAEHICRLQGFEGQWWWHYDVRSGKSLEGYPVYSVHQDAMAPMALFALQDASSMDYSRWIDRGISWLIHPPETRKSLIDRNADLIWRKIARHEPFKFVRTAQAVLSKVHQALRVPAVDYIFRPNWVDYECRPYHMGWILYAWPIHRLASFEQQIHIPEEAEVMAEANVYSHWENWSLSPAYV